MNFKLLHIGLLVFTTCTVNAQIFDTLYFDITGNLTIKELGKIYRTAEYDTISGGINGVFTDYTKFDDTLCTGEYFYNDSIEDFEVVNYKGSKVHEKRATKMCKLKSSEFIRIRDYYFLRRFIKPYKTFEERVHHPNGFIVVEDRAMFPGGMERLGWFFSQFLTYPEEAYLNDISGTVIVQFTVNTDGSISNVKVKEGIGYGCDEEALRVVRIMPDWLPGIQHGKTVKMDLSVPIKFQ